MESTPTPGEAFLAAFEHVQGVHTQERDALAAAEASPPHPPRRSVWSRWFDGSADAEPVAPVAPGPAPALVAALAQLRATLLDSPWPAPAAELAEELARHTYVVLDTAGRSDARTFLDAVDGLLMRAMPLSVELSDEPEERKAVLREISRFFVDLELGEVADRAAAERRMAELEAIMATWPDQA